VFFVIVPGITVTVHLIIGLSNVLIKRLWPALGRFERTFGQSLDPREKSVIAKRPADALGGTQRFEQVFLR